jgi:hypothetical protein
MNKKSIENIFQNCGVSHPKRSTYFHSFDWDLSWVLELVIGYNVNQQRENLSFRGSTRRHSRWNATT